MHKKKPGRKLVPIMRRLNLGSRFRIKEPVSAISHFAGAMGAILGLIAFFFLPRTGMSMLHFAAFVFYGFSMFAVYLASALYHGLPLSISGEKFMNRIDHAMIYVFIAGSYAPVFLVATPPSLSTPLLGSVLVIGTFGIFSEFSVQFKSRPNSRIWGAGIYVAMGWMGVFGLKTLYIQLPLQGCALLALGGILYTVGAILYGLKRPNPWPRFFGFHELFHLFILGGSMSHFILMWKYVLPLSLGHAPF